MRPPAGAEPGLRALAAIGVEAWGIADGAGYDAIWPGCRSVVLAGALGRRPWPHARARGGEDPIDGAVRDALRSTPHGEGRWVRFASERGDPEDPTRPVPGLHAQPLALAAGLGRPSRLGLVLHPQAGPWFALRAAWFSSTPATPTGPLPGPSPCAACAAPCAAACPAGALSDGGWDAARCVAWRTGAADRAAGCPDASAARAACPEGAEHRYGDDQHAHHHREAVRQGWIRPAR